MRPRCTAIFLSSASTETASEQNATDMAQRVFIVHRALVKPWKIVRQLVRQREIHIVEIHNVEIHIILELRILPTDVVINDFNLIVGLWEHPVGMVIVEYTPTTCNDSRRDTRVISCSYFFFHDKYLQRAMDIYI